MQSCVGLCLLDFVLTYLAACMFLGNHEYERAGTCMLSKVCYQETGVYGLGSCSVFDMFVITVIEIARHFLRSCLLEDSWLSTEYM